MTEKLEREKDIIEVYKNMLQIINDFKGTEKAMNAAMRNIALHSSVFDTNKFLEIFLTKQYVENIVRELEKNLRLTEETIGKLDGVDQKVVYRRDVEHKSLGLIADELGYSWGYIKNISSRNPRKQKRRKM